MAKKQEDNRDGSSHSEEWYKAVARDLAKHEGEQPGGGIDENLIAAYTSGRCTAVEKAQVEQAMRQFPDVRECVEAVLKAFGLKQPTESGALEKTTEEAVWVERVQETNRKRNSADDSSPSGNSPVPDR